MLVSPYRANVVASAALQRSEHGAQGRKKTIPDIVTRRGKLVHVLTPFDKSAGTYCDLHAAIPLFLWLFLWSFVWLYW